MAQRKKTVTEHIENGTYRADRHGLPQTEGKHLETLPNPPTKLNDLGLFIYNVTGNALIEQKILKETDIMTLAAYAREAAMYEEQSIEAAAEIVVKLANGVTTVSHNRKAAESALKNMIVLGDRLGLSPKSRFGLAANVPPTNSKAKQASILDLIKGGAVAPKTKNG
jgi:phage terminase small subunit